MVERVARVVDELTNEGQDTCEEYARRIVALVYEDLRRRAKKLTPAPASEYAGRILLEEADVLALLKGEEE